MGNIGSTRWKEHSRKICAEECLHFDIMSLKRAGILCESSVERLMVLRESYSKEIAASIRYVCRQVDEEQTLILAYANQGHFVQIPITITHETKHWGGSVPIFLCPLCGRRARKLYIPPGALRFACRSCHDLTYRSCQTAHHYDRGVWGRHGMNRRMIPRIRPYYNLSSEPL